MRNVAKRSCQTDYTFVVDIDMVPNPGLELELRDFLTQKGLKLNMSNLT